AEHLGVGQQVVAKGYRLGDLQMGKARHDGGDVFERHDSQCIAQLAQQVVQVVDLGAQPKADVGGYLVVARAPGVQPLAGIAYQFHQPFLDIQVHVFQVEQPLEAAGVDFFQDLGHAALDVGQVLRGDDALRGQHVRVRQRTLDV